MPQEQSADQQVAPQSLDQPQHPDQGQEGPPAQSHPSPPSGDEDGIDLEGTLRQIESEKRAAVEPKEDEPKEKPPVPKASQFASLHRREQQFVQKQRELAQQYEAREKALAEKEAIFAKGKHTPFEALKLLGFDDPKAFLERIAENGGEWSPEQQKIYELEQWRSQREAQDKEREQRLSEEKQQQEYKQSLDRWHTSIAQYVKQSPKWSSSVVSLPNAEQKVFQVIQDHYQSTGEQMEFDDAITQVESNLAAEMRTALHQIAGVQGGRAILEEILTKLAPEPKRGKSVSAHKQGITSAVRNQTRSLPPEDMDLDSAVAANAQWLSEVTRRGS